MGEPQASSAAKHKRASQRGYPVGRPKSAGNMLHAPEIRFEPSRRVPIGGGGSAVARATAPSSARRATCAVALNWGWDTKAIFGHVDPHPPVEVACAGSYGQVFSSKLCEAHFRCSEYAD